MGCLVGRDSNNEPEPAASGAPAGGSTGASGATTITAEEKAMLANEKKLPFSSINSIEIIQALAKETKSERTMSMPQLKRALSDLKIDPQRISNPDDPFYGLIKKFKNPQKLFDLKEMSVLAALLGKGTPKEKAEWLFKQYDVDASGMLAAHEIEEMIQHILKVACEILPSVSKGEGPGLLTSEQISAYFDVILASKEPIVQKATQMVLTEAEISQHEFVLKMCDPQLQCNQLLTSLGVRLLCKKLI